MKTQLRTEKERILRPALALCAKSKVIEVAGDGFYLFNVYLSELCRFNSFTEFLVSRIDGFQLIDPFQWKRCDQHLNNRLNSLLLTEEMF